MGFNDYDWFDFNRDGDIDLWEHQMKYQHFKKYIEPGWKEFWRSGNYYQSGFVEDSIWDSEEDYEAEPVAPLRENFPNQRTFAAADFLWEMRPLLECSDSWKEDADVLRAEFILTRWNLLAARYLTMESGFLFAQAIQDTFPLPVEFPAEDEEVKTTLRDVLGKLSEADPLLAVDILDWCAEQFGPYMEYDACEKSLYALALCRLEDYPLGFLSALNLRLGENPTFCETILQGDTSGLEDVNVLLRVASSEADAAAVRAICKAILWNQSIQDLETVRIVGKAIFDVCKNGSAEQMDLVREQILPEVQTCERLGAYERLPVWEGWLSYMRKEKRKGNGP